MVATVVLAGAAEFVRRILSAVRFQSNEKYEDILANYLVLVLVGLAQKCKRQAAGPQLNLFAWSEYVPQEVIDGFTKETGIRGQLRDLRLQRGDDHQAASGVDAV